MIILTKHTKEMMVERGITKEQIKMAIERGSKVKQTNGFKTTYSYIGVCYKIKGEKHIIKTITIE